MGDREREMQQFQVDAGYHAVQMLGASSPTGRQGPRRSLRPANGHRGGDASGPSALSIASIGQMTRREAR